MKTKKVMDAKAKTLLNALHQSSKFELKDCVEMDHADCGPPNVYENDNPQHTPPPWTFDILPAGYVIQGDLKGKDDSGMPSHTETVGEVGQRSNAELIVRAVNAHEALLDVVKEALCHLDPNCEYDGANANGKEVSEYAKLVIAMYEAIAKAEGK